MQASSCDAFSLPAIVRHRIQECLALLQDRLLEKLELLEVGTFARRLLVPLTTGKTGRHSRSAHCDVLQAVA